MTPFRWQFRRHCQRNGASQISQAKQHKALKSLVMANLLFPCVGHVGTQNAQVSEPWTIGTPKKTAFRGRWAPHFGPPKMPRMNQLKHAGLPVISHAQNQHFKSVSSVNHGKSWEIMGDQLVNEPTWTIFHSKRKQKYWKVPETVSLTAWPCASASEYCLTEIPGTGSRILKKTIHGPCQLMWS